MGVNKNNQYTDNELIIIFYYHIFGSGFSMHKFAYIKIKLYLCTLFQKINHMKTLLIFLSVITMQSVDSVIMRLDETLAEHNSFISQKEEYINNLKQLYALSSDTLRFSYSEQIFEAYNGFNTDSAQFYANLCLRVARHIDNPILIQRAQIYQAKCWAVTGMYEAAMSTFNIMESNLYTQNANLFYKEYCLTCVWQGEFSTIDTERAAARAQVPYLRSMIIQTEPDNSIWTYQEQALMHLDQPDSALAILLPVFNQLPSQSNYIRFFANTIGSCYRAKGNIDYALYYYALSAISDLENAVMEHASLREVALIMLQKGDINHAYEYMNCCIEDARFCQARLRTIEMANDMPVILDSYRNAITQSQTKLKNYILLLIGAVLILIILSIIMIVLQGRVRSAHRQTLQAKEQLAEKNQLLEKAMENLKASNNNLIESNRISHTYITQYMAECSDIIDKLDEYHKSLLRLSLQGKPNALFERIKSNETTEDVLRDFYRHFDSTFLNLCPHFVERLNDLLQPEGQFTIPEHNHLSTPLRIFALIRLGITDSEDIAHFLRLSVKTVYNYRTITRNYARTSRNDLDPFIRAIPF